MNLYLYLYTSFFWVNRFCLFCTLFLIWNVSFHDFSTSFFFFFSSNEWIGFARMPRFRFFLFFFFIPSLPFISALLLRNYFIANKWPINLLCTMSSDVCGVICNVYVMGVLRELLCYKFCNSRLCPEVSSITDACSIQTDYQHTYSVSQTMRTTLFSGILQIIRQV